MLNGNTLFTSGTGAYGSAVLHCFLGTDIKELLNAKSKTSFNENEPSVNRPKEALDCLLKTKMDVLLMGPYMLRRTA